jgi:alpha-tubulin suppressor-like RCC1 family protein
MLTATGTPTPTFQWRKNGAPISGATGASFSIASVQTTDAGSFDCVATNTAGAANSTPAMLIVLPAFTTQPQSQVIAAGSNATLTSAASGAPPLTYQWKRNGLPVAGATAASYTITGAVSVRDDGWYQLIATNASGAATSATVFVNVATGPTQIVAWGGNTEGETSVPGGLTDAIAGGAGGAHAVALRANGTVVAWGRNAEGQATVPGGLTNVVGVSAGIAHTVALKSDGTVVAWGANDYGQSSVPGGLSGVVSVAAGGYHTVALKADGTIVAWGDNSSGQITIPAALVNVIAIAAGGAHTVALRANGTVVAWGYNGSGQATVPGGLSNISDIAAGYYHTVALKADGTVVAWGWSGYAQASVPAGLSAIAGVSAGGTHSVAERLDGTVVAWGDNSSGQTRVPAGSTKVFRLAAGGDHTVALRDARILPVIATQPANQSVLAAQPATFSVVATGTPAPTWQWRKNGAAIGGAINASYTIAATVVADAGSYDVLVTNSLGTVTSAAAALTIGKVTPTLAWSTPTAVAYGVALSATQLNATASVPGAFVYTPAAGTVLGAGVAQTLSVAFTPTDTANYNNATRTTTLTVTPNFASWEFANFTTAELLDPAKSGPNAVFGLDGFSNLVKYALGLDPKQDVVTGLPEVSVQGPDWVETYTRPAGLTDLVYTVERSADLTTWTTAGVTHEFVLTAAGIETWRARYPLASAANVFFRLKIVRAGDTACAPPVGGMTINAPAAQATSLSLPLLHASIGTGTMLGRVGAVGVNYVDVPTAGWNPGDFSNSTNPYYVRFRTGALAGRMMLVAPTANTATRLFLSTDGTDLTTAGVVTGAQGDAFEIILADTLGSFFGSGTLLGGATDTVADTVQVWGGGSWIVFYYNTTRLRWENSTDIPASLPRDNFVLRPDRGFMLTRRAAVALRIYVTGRVTETAPKSYHTRPGNTFVSAGVPVDVTLGTLALHTQSGWQSGATAATATATADLVQIWGGGSWLYFYYDSTFGYWRNTTDVPASLSRNTFAVPAGRPMMIRRLTTGGNILNLSRPYSIAP